MDGWTSPNVFSFLGVTAHWFDGTQLQHIILDFVRYVLCTCTNLNSADEHLPQRLKGSHTGKYLAAELVESLKEYGLEKKVRFRHCDCTCVELIRPHSQILGIASDNAESNDVMMKELHVLVPEIRGMEARVRCFGHVLNLVVKVCSRRVQLYSISH